MPVATPAWLPDHSSATNHGCSNYASATLKVGLPSDMPTFGMGLTFFYGKGSCAWQCAHTSGCVGFAWLEDSDTTCKSASQSKGSCTLWKEACIPDYSLSCKKWLQYKMKKVQWEAPPSWGWASLVALRWRWWRGSITWKFKPCLRSTVMLTKINKREAAICINIQGMKQAKGGHETL